MGRGRAEKEEKTEESKSNGNPEALNVYLPKGCERHRYNRSPDWEPGKTAPGQLIRCLPRGKTRPLGSSVSPSVSDQLGGTPSSVASSPNPAPLAGCAGSSPAQSKVRVRSPSRPGASTRGPRPAGADRAPDTPPPAGLPALAPGPLFPRRGLPPGPRRSRPVSPGSPLGRPGRASAATPRAKAPPGTARPLRTLRGSSPRGTENNGRERPAPRRAHWPPRTPPGNPALLLANPAPSPTVGWGGRAKGIVGVVVHRGGRAAGRGAELGVESSGGATAPAAGKSADRPSRPQGWPE